MDLNDLATCATERISRKQIDSMEGKEVFIRSKNENNGKININ